MIKIENYAKAYTEILKIIEYLPDSEYQKIPQKLIDQFALAYLLKSQDRFNIEAITVAPYHHDNGISIQEGLDKSYNEIIKICNWLNFNSKNKVFKGSTGYIEDGYSGNNDAVNKIIEIASKNTKTYILAIGAITMVELKIIVKIAKI